MNCHRIRTSSVFDQSDYQQLKTFTQRLQQLEKKSRENHEYSLRKIHSMSALNLIPTDSSSSLRTYSINNDDKSNNSNSKEKQISLEVKTNSYNRKIQVKTKQEDTICTMKTPSIVTRVITTETPPPLSPHRISVIRGQRRSSSKLTISSNNLHEDFLHLVSNSSIQNIRVSVTTSPNDRESGKTAETHFSFATPVINHDESYSTMISNFVSENLAKSSKLDDDTTFDHRPLLDLITQLNRRHTLNESSSSSPTPIPTTSNEILPAKLLSPFRPMIVHKKQQVLFIHHFLVEKKIDFV